MTNCDGCSHCRKCRTAMFPPPTVTDDQRQRAREVMERLDAEPEHKPRTPRKIVSAAVAMTKPRGGASSPQEKPVETPCRECGGMRALLISGARGIAVSGKGGLCEPCSEFPKRTEDIKRHESGEKVMSAHTLRSARKYVQRVLRDGRAFHPGATHGTTSGYGLWGCRCQPCREAKAAYISKFKKRSGK